MINPLRTWTEDLSALAGTHLRLGVTGLSRAGKTVFITQLVHGLMHRSRLLALRAQAEGRILAVTLTPQPALDAPRFAVESHIETLLADPPRWPQSTRQISQLRLSIRYQSRSLLGQLTGPSVLDLDIVDYPGEWLLDLPMMEMDYADWSRQSLELAAGRGDAGAAWLSILGGIDGNAPHEEGLATRLHGAFCAYLRDSRKAGLSAVAPGRFLMPGDLEGAPALSFVPLPPLAAAQRGSLWAEMERRYEGYKRHVVFPFFRDHFARLDRQIVLIDLLGAFTHGAAAVTDLRQALAGVLGCFRPGARSWLMPLLGRRIDRVLVAATKADHIHSQQHARLQDLAAELVAGAVERARFSGAEVQALAMASLRATTEVDHPHGGRLLGCVRGRLLTDGVPGAEKLLYPGELPKGLGGISAGRWLTADFAATAFAAPRLTPRAGEGLPHIRLDRAIEFLLGDYLQ